MISRFFVFLIAIVLGLSPGPPNVDPAGTVVLLDAEAENRLSVGDLARLELISNATTGYTWVVDDNEYFALVSDEYIAPDTGLIGAPGMQVFTFRALAEGSAELILRYVRPWETGTAPAQTITIRITVE